MGAHASTSALEYDDFAGGQISSVPELAAECALFMNLPMNTPVYPPFPGSTPSDPCGSPGTSHASSGEWDTDQEREDTQFLSTPVSSPPQLHPQSFSDPAFHHYLRKTEKYDTLTPLEMPDGSTRLTANWLPVDPGAGFTIGPSSSCHSSDDWDPLAAPSFRHNQIAFIPAKPPASACGG